MCLQDDFNEAIKDAVPAISHFVSLYVDVPFYGGPEEGGWWGEDRKLVCYKEYPTEAQAEVGKAAVAKVAENRSAEAKRAWGEHCSRQVDWCEERGLEPDYLAETSGPDRYFVELEENLGSMEYKGCRHYE